MTPIAPETKLTVTLEVQQWNVVLAGVSELKLKDVLSLWQLLTDQLQGQVQVQAPASVGNGADLQPPKQFLASDLVPPIPL